MSHPTRNQVGAAKERPILFSGSMVRALLAGTKTQTRRVVKPQPTHFNPVGVPRRANPDGPSAFITCPYGEPGDLLWVRESFWGCDLPGYGDQPCVVYDDEWKGKEYAPEAARPWARKFGRIPSIHMPRDCSRILLKITDVRVERLQSMSDDDMSEEGLGMAIEDENSPAGRAFSYYEHMAIGGAPLKMTPEKYGWVALWDSINGAGHWASNPWVWAVSFRRLP